MSEALDNKVIIESSLKPNTLTFGWIPILMKMVGGSKSKRKLWLREHSVLSSYLTF